jgi:hypothetical protein
MNDFEPRQTKAQRNQTRFNRPRSRRAAEALAAGGGVALLLAMPVRLHGQSIGGNLPDAPSAVLAAADHAGLGISTSAATNPSQTHTQTQTPAPQQGLPPYIAAPGAQPPAPLPATTDQQKSASLPPCPRRAGAPVPIIFLPQTGSGCQREDQLQFIVDTGTVRPLTPTDKGILAIRAVTDPFNLLTIVAFSGISVAANAHSDYGPGFRGWGKLIGYSLTEDIQGEFTGTYALPVIFHEDPRYHRMPNQPVVRRVEHALIHTVVSQHDDGRLMLNYATLINYPLSDELSNLYVPGLPTNAESTFKRVALGYATDPVGPLVAEFLPDLAKRVHIHIVFAQQILNRIAQGNTTGGNAPL